MSDRTRFGLALLAAWGLVLASIASVALIVGADVADWQRAVLLAVLEEHLASVVLVSLLLVWLTCIALPALLISTLAAADVDDLRGAIAFVQTETPLTGTAALAQEVPAEAQAIDAPPPEAKALSVAPDPPSSASRCADRITYSFGSCVPGIVPMTLCTGTSPRFFDSPVKRRRGPWLFAARRATRL